jgi:hypothetical protein
MVANDLDVYFAREMNGVFGTNVLVTEDLGIECDPAVGVTAEGLPCIVWISKGDEDSEVRYAAATRIGQTPLASNLIDASEGGIVGTELAAIDSVDDVCVEVPGGAFWTDVQVAVSRIENPPMSDGDSVSGVIAAYEFGPSSSLEFANPVTITIPFEPTALSAQGAYWYDTNSGSFSQSGMSNVEIIELSATLHAVRFKTTHFTPYVLVGPAQGADKAHGR